MSNRIPLPNTRLRYGCTAKGHVRTPRSDAKLPVGEQLLMVESGKRLAKEVRVACCMNGVEALRYLERVKGSPECPSLILLDVNMPLLNGKETLLEIKRRSELRHIPVMIYTTTCHPSENDFFLRNGALGCIIKPASQKEFEKMFAGLLPLPGVKQPQ